MISYRPVALADAEAFLALSDRIYPYLVRTPDRLRQLWSGTAPAAHPLMLAAWDGPLMVGWLRARINTWMSEPGVAELRVLVHDDYRGQGIGATLLERGEQHLRDHQARRIYGQALDDAAAARFLTRRGYAIGEPLHYSGLDLTTLSAPAAVPAGVQVTSLREIGPRATYEVDCAASPDEPGQDGSDQVTYDEWVQLIWESETLMTDISMGVVADGQLVSFTMLQADRARGVGYTVFTATLRAHRSRGYARLAKLATFQGAAAAGLTRVYTANHGANPPMLRVNAQLGYQRVATEREVSKALTHPTSEND